MATLDNVLVHEYDNRRWHFDWVVPALLHPRQTMARVAAADRGLVSTPLVLWLVAAILVALIAGSIRAEAAASGQIPPPPQYYTPEQQAQYQQAMAATSGPVFTYVLPATVAAAGVLAYIVLAGMLLHLFLTLLGGRGSSQQKLNIVAWASIPLIVRSFVRAGYMMSSGAVVAYPGLSGFAPGGEGILPVLAASLLAAFDFYLLWHAALLLIGLGVAERLRGRRILVAVLLTLLLVMLLRAVPALLAAQLGDLTFTRPFMY
jgi:hypothetical protein